MAKKLVRDKIPEMYSGQRHYAADSDEYHRELIKKLQEEVDQFKQDENIVELADIIEVVHAISEFKGTPIEELEKIRNDKVEKRGAFKKRIIYEK